jgi:hypothetical protein
MIGPWFLLCQVFPWFRRVLQFFSPISSVVAKLAGKFTSLEEPTDDPDIVIVLILLADGSSFIKSEGRIKPKGLTKKLRLSIVNSIFWFSSTSELLLAKSEKAIEFMIPTPRVPTVGAN